MTDWMHRNSSRDSNTVTVFSFKIFDPESCAMQLARGKATRAAIAATHQAEAVPGTAEEVPRQALDDHGHYRRVATGWGALD